MNPILSSLLALFSLSRPAHAAALKVGDPAPAFQVEDHEGKPFDLASRKGKWTVLYFYPKADTPGCTKQACTFRDSLAQIRKLGAEVYGISTDKVKAIRAFHEKHHLTFPLLADPDHKVTSAYGAAMLGGLLAKRWTFIIDPALVIQSIDTEVDPVKDAERSAAKIQELQNKK